LAAVVAIANSFALGNWWFHPLSGWQWLHYVLAGACCLAIPLAFWSALRQKRNGLILLAVLCLPVYPVAHVGTNGWPLTPAEAAAKKRTILSFDQTWLSYYYDRVDYFDERLAPYLLADSAFTNQLTQKLAVAWRKWLGSITDRPAISYDTHLEDLVGLAEAVYVARRYQGQTTEQALADQTGSRLLLLLGNTHHASWFFGNPSRDWLRQRLGLAAGDHVLISPALWASQSVELASRPALLDTLACRWLLSELTYVPRRVPPATFTSLVERWLAVQPLEQAGQVQALAALRNQVAELAPQLAVNDTLLVDFATPAQRGEYWKLARWLNSTGWPTRLDTTDRPKLFIGLQRDSTFIETRLEPVYKTVTRTRLVTKSRQVPQTTSGRRGRTRTTYKSETYEATESYTDYEQDGERPVNYYRIRQRIQIGPSPQQLGKTTTIEQALQTKGYALTNFWGERSWVYGLPTNW
jgi:hypothetical protein